VEAATLSVPEPEAIVPEPEVLELPQPVPPVPVAEPRFPVFLTAAESSVFVPGSVYSEPDPDELTEEDPEEPKE
jgi:hypothetical protein